MIPQIINRNLSYYIPQYKQIVINNPNNFIEPRTSNEKLNHFFKKPQNSIYSTNKVLNNSSINMNIFNFLDLQENKENKIFFGNYKTINYEIDRLKNLGYLNK